MHADPRPVLNYCPGSTTTTTSRRFSSSPRAVSCCPISATTASTFACGSVLEICRTTVDSIRTHHCAIKSELQMSPSDHPTVRPRIAASCCAPERLQILFNVNKCLAYLLPTGKLTITAIRIEIKKLVFYILHRYRLIQNKFSIRVYADCPCLPFIEPLAHKLLRGR